MKGDLKGEFIFNGEQAFEVKLNAQGGSNFGGIVSGPTCLILREGGRKVPWLVCEGIWLWLWGKPDEVGQMMHTRAFAT